jgi:FkbM family methyltransferase
MKTLRQRLLLAVKERVFRRCGIPFSRHGVDPSVVRFLQASGPLNYVDVGASVGSVARSVDAQYGVRRGILVEPQPARCLELKRSFSAPRFSVHQCALSDQESMCEMEVLEWDYSSSILPVRRDLPKVSAVLDLSVREKINCRVTTLDTLMTEAGWVGSVDLLKIDVQGAELLALRGAEQTLPRVRFILTEVSFTPLYEGSCVFGQVYDLLSERGFRLLSLQDGFRGGDGELLQSDALFGR